MKRLADDGFAIAINYAANAAEAEGLADQIRKAGGNALAVRRMSAVPCRRRSLRRGAIGLRRDRHPGQLRGLHEAGAGGRGRRCHCSTAHIAINLKGTFNTMREAARVMNDGGRIINFSSSAVEIVPPEPCRLSASKAGVQGDHPHSLQGTPRPAASQSMRSRRVRRRPPTSSRQAEEVIDSLANVVARAGAPAGTPDEIARHGGFTRPRGAGSAVRCCARMAGSGEALRRVRGAGR